MLQICTLQAKHPITSEGLHHDIPYVNYAYISFSHFKHPSCVL